MDILIKDILISKNLQWHQVVSILMDNCAVMRGKKGGLEIHARKENPFLLDISEDTMPFGTEVQDFGSDIYYNIDRSPKPKKIFTGFQNFLHLP